MSSPGQYRAKRVDGTGWAKGSCFEDAQQGKMYIIQNQVVSHYADARLRPSVFLIEVIPESVGQYTGRKDKSADEIEIYGGDIVGSRYFPVNLIVTQIDHGVNTGQWIVKAQDGGIQDLHEAITADGYVVIGNVTDNKELLKEQA